MEVDYEKIFLNKLPITAATGDSNWNHYAMVESSWGERKILLKIIVFSPIYNTPLSFLSEIDHDVLQQTAIRLERTREEFLAETRVALCTDGGAPGFSYSVEDNNFVWRKMGGPLTVTYGSVILLRSTICLVSDVLQNSSNVQSHLRSVVQQRNQILLELKEQHEELLLFQRQQEEDNRLYEIELITKCISILNEKKEVIAMMKQQLADDEEADEDDVEDGRKQDDSTVAAGSAAAPISGSDSVGRIDFSDSDAFDSPLQDHDQELEHQQLPKRSKLQQLMATAATTPRSSATATRNEAGESSADVYSKDTEELLQNM